MADFLIDSLRGGADDFTPPSQLPKDMAQLAENVEHFYSTLGERRLGTATISFLPVGITGNASFAEVVWMFRHEPTTAPEDAELWVMSVDTPSIAPTNPRLFRFTFSAGWIEYFMADDPIVSDEHRYQIYGASLHGKMFMAYKSAVDRLHVWDPDSGQVRRVGVDTMSGPPVITDSALGGAYPAVLRYYRTRAVIKVGAVVTARSEPTDSVAFTPSGANFAAVVTRDNFEDASATHWEVEASTDNVTFYRISTELAATTFYSDTALVATYVDNPQSDPIGSYGLIPSVQYLTVDNDRLLTLGSHETEADKSAVQWTPVGSDPLPGPDERFNETTNPRLDLDAAQGGGGTAISAGVTGVVYAFKWSHSYRLHRTGQLVGSYEAELVTTSIGALPRSLVEARDEAGNPSLYFLDPDMGSMRAGMTTLQWLGHGQMNLWNTVNTSATVPCHGLFYPFKQQVHYWLAVTYTDTVEPTPSGKLVLQVNEIESTPRGGRRGWSTVPPEDGGTIGFSNCSVLYFDPTDGVSSVGIGRMRPLIGKAAAASAIRRCDTGTTDNGTAYVGLIRTRPYFLANILNRYGFNAGAILGLAGTNVRVNLVRDFGTESISVDADFTAVGSEEWVIAALDNCSMAELFALEVEFTDDPDNINSWRLLQFALRPSMEQSV